MLLLKVYKGTITKPREGLKNNVCFVLYMDYDVDMFYVYRKRLF